MNDNLILLQAKLDEAKSKKNINADINKIQNQIDKLKLQSEIDPKTISNLAKQLEGILNQKINISNISVDSETGQQLSTTISQDIVDGISKANGNITTKLKETASKTVSSVGKSVVSSIISKGIEFVFNGIDNLIHKTEKAKEEIAQLQSESNHSESNIGFMNSELQTTKEKIEELEKKGNLSFTDNVELEQLKEHNYELERSISLEEKKRKAANIKAVAGISDNQKGLEKDFNESLNKYKKKQNKIENLQVEIQKRSQNNAYDEEDVALVEKKLAKEKENLDVYKSKVSEEIANYEVNKQTILNKYNGDYSAITGNDKQLYDSITQQLNDAYELIYSDEEYNKLIIEPFFDMEGLEDTKGKLFSYFTGGGKLDETALRQALGDSIVNSLQQACELAGIEFPDMLQRISDSTNNTLDAFAPKISNPNSQYDVEQNLNSDAKRKYFQTLDEETQALLINTEIPETVKQSTLEEFKNFIATLQENGNATAIVNKQSIENAWTSLANTDDEEQKSTQSDLLELAKKGQLTEATFHNTTGADTFLDSINKSLPETIDWINSLVTSSEQLSYLQSNISSIQNAFSDFQENGSASAETLAGMSDELKQLRGWDSFAETLGDSSSSAEECRQAMNDLASEYVNSNNFLSQLNDTNKDYYISTLSNMGVENAEEVVTQALTNKVHALAMEKEFCAEKGYNLSEATAEDVNEFIKEHHYSQEAATALYQLALQKQLFNGTTIDFSSDIAKIAEYVDKLNGVSYSLRTLNDITNGKYSVPSSDYNTIKTNSQQEVDDVNKSNVKLNDNPKTNNQFGSTNNYNTKGNSSAKESKQTIDWISRKLEVLQKNIDATKAKFDNLFSVKKKESNLNTQIKQTTALLNASKKAAIAYKNQADKVKLSKDKKVNKNLKKKVRNGKYNINDYSSNTAEKINKYKDYYDKYKQQEKQVAELRTSKRELKEQKYQLHVDNANAKIDKSKAWMELDSGNYKEQNKHLNAQKDYIKESYKYQIKIADLNKDSIKVSQLKAEKEKELRDIEKQKFDNIANQYENELSVTQAKQDAISREIDLIQARGDMLDQSKYQSQIALENQKIASLEQEKQLLEEQLKLKKLVEGTDEWHEAKEVITGINEEIDKSKQSISEMTKSINEIGETLRTKILDSFERIKTESDWLVGIMDNVEDFDDQTHAATNEGIARLASYITGSNISKQQADFVQQWLDELSANKDSNGEAHFKSALTGTDINYTADEYAEAWKNAYEELRNYNSQYTDYKNKAIEWEISKLKAELSIMQEIIDAKKDALQSEKDLHNYQKSIQQSTKNIGLLQKQIAAVQGDTSEEGIARIQKLQKELTDAQDDLNETEYDRYLSDQEELLDKLYQEYEELINSESKQREVLFNRAIQDADNNTNTVIKTNEKYADMLGYKFESNMQNLYSQNGSISNNVASILSTLQNGIVVTTSQSTTSPAATDNAPSSPASSNTEQLPGIVKEIGNISFGDSIVAGLDMTRREVENYIEKKGKEPDKGHSYKAVNATLANKYKKVLSDADLKTLAKKLGIKYDNSSKSGNLYNALKALQLSGFKKGGIATDLNKIALDNGDDGWVTVQRGEGILTPVQTETFTKDFIPRMDFMMDSAKTLDALVKNANFERQQNPTNIDAHYEFNLENCTNASDIIRQIQTDSNIRKALQDVTINQIHKSGKSLGVNRFI